MTDEHRSKVPYYDETLSLASVRIEPEGKSYEVHEDIDSSYYVIEDDGERTYLIWG